MEVHGNNLNLQGMFKIWKLLKNKYLLTALVLAVWILGFDENDVFRQWDMVQRCEKLKQDKAFYTSEIAYCKALSQALKTDTAAMIRLARERYHMKREGEELFIIVPEKH
jgi:cell division protein FtsB